MKSMKTQGWDLAAWGFVIYLAGSVLGSLVSALSFLSLVGLILFLIGLYQVAQSLGRPQIFTDQLIGRVILWIGVFLTGGAALVEVARSLEGSEVSLSSILAGALIFWLLSVAAAWFIRRSFKALAKASKRTLFSLAGDLIFWGAVAGIILIGYLVVFAGEVVALIAFFRGPTET